MYTAFVRAISSTKQSKNFRLNKTYQVSLKKIVALLLVAVIAVSLFAFATNRISTYRDWSSMVIGAQEFKGHIYEARALGAVGSDNPDFSVARNEMRYAMESLDKIQRLDRLHSVELGRIENLLIDLYGLNDTQRLELSSQAPNLPRNLELIGNKVLSAYTGFINYTYINTEEGPPFWYFGPSPPDEPTLQEAVNLATQANALIR